MPIAPTSATSPGDGAIRLRPAGRDDLEALFEMQSDLASNAMAGTKPRSREAFWAAWERIFADPGVSARVIECEGVVVGSISRFQAEGRECVGYWVARPHWGRSIASRALALFLAEDGTRPLHATTAAGNIASRRALERCGFVLVGQRFGEETERYVASEIAEYVLE